MTLVLPALLCIYVGNENGVAHSSDGQFNTSDVYIDTERPVLNMVYKPSLPRPANTTSSSGYEPIAYYMQQLHVHLPFGCSFLLLFIICVGCLPWMRRERSPHTLITQGERPTDDHKTPKDDDHKAPKDDARLCA